MTGLILIVKFLSISGSNPPCWDLYHVILLRYAVFKNKEIHNKLPYVYMEQRPKSIPKFYVNAQNEIQLQLFEVGLFSGESIYNY